MTGLKLCFWGCAEGNPSIKMPLHSHDYYQMQFSLAGECDFITESTRVHIEAGDILLIAPNVPHTLEYRKTYLSHAYKFFCQDMPDFFPFFHVPGNATTRGIIQAAENILKSTFPLQFINVKEGTVIIPGSRYQVLMEHFLVGVIAFLFQEASPAAGITAKIYDLLKHSPSHIFSVKEVAEACGYSRNHFSLLIRQQTGLSARDFLNGIKLKIAQDYLRYTNKTIEEISATLGFSSQFHFSSFFKRHAGISPLKFRKIGPDSGLASETVRTSAGKEVSGKCE